MGVFIQRDVKHKDIKIEIIFFKDCITYVENGEQRDHLNQVTVVVPDEEEMELDGRFKKKKKKSYGFQLFLDGEPKRLTNRLSKESENF